MVLRLLLCFLLPVSLYAARDTGYYSAIVRVERLLLAERKMVGKIKHYISQGGEVTGDLRSFVDSYEESWLHPPRDDPLHFAHHPVGAYLLIKRLSQNHMEDIFQQAQDLIEKPSILVDLPDKDDLEMSAFALVRLQVVYSLDISSLVFGQVVMTVTSPHKGPQWIAITDVEPTLTLDLTDTMFIGDVAVKQNHFEDAISWYNFNLNSANGPAEKAKVLSRIAIAHSKLKQHERALAIYEEALQLDPDNQILYADYDDAKLLAADDDTPAEEIPAELIAQRDKSQHLCRLDVLQIQAPPRRGLKCRYIRDSPHLYLSPAKMEVLHRKNPRLVMYHDVISQNEARTLRSTAFPKFSRALSMDDEGRIFIDKYAISESGTILDTEDAFIEKMSKRVGHVTGLDTELPYAEPLMVVNYGLGGAIQHHLDYMAEAYRHITDVVGNRMMTFLIYLNEVEAGGAVVFPEIGLITPAVQNAALMIQNLKKSGDYMPLTLHAACPVLIGSKWTAVKFIREFGNEFKWPCGLTPAE
ncbi:prolyl 4-hydroxylase subunit alpha-3-like [Branchiostoma floridae x Branchiostoma japonicum]